MWHLLRLGGDEPTTATTQGVEVAQDSQWSERDPDGVAADRELLYIAQDGSGEWGIETDRREADGWIVEDSSNRWGVDTNAQRGGHIIKVGSLPGVKV